MSLATAKAIAAVVALWFLALQFVAGNPIYNVLSYGAVGDGTSNDVQAFSKAWRAACADANYPIILIPASKTFLLTEVTFRGPCKSWMYVQLDGNIVAPNKVWSNQAKNLIAFQDVNNVTVAGHGEIDGNGAIWWDCVKHKGVEVWAPGDSPNTDALHIAGSQFVEFTNCTVGIGDDCVAIGPGSSDINITHIICGPGHGLSIGSLGPNSKVERVHISDSHVSGASSGVKIKTWQGGSGYAKEIYFERVNFTSVQIPIVIDQYYCPSHQCHPTNIIYAFRIQQFFKLLIVLHQFLSIIAGREKQNTSNVAISDIQFVDLYGTSSQKEAVSIQCSKQVPCNNILMKNINIYHEDGSSATSNCSNAYGKTEGVVIPNVSFLH
uniref:Polygalacturonase-2-like n=1 Tax=Elaeis guineensis var. tenera TaxID=51953 RepID=A0A6J0PE30_ELAGV|nr:polygalacturonase-2-like [Elaeis guineensis]